MLHSRVERLALRLTSRGELDPAGESCHQFGDCGLEVYRTTKKLLSQGVSDFKVIDGMVYLNHDQDHPVPHSWINANGRIIDPTESQFHGASVDYSLVPGEYRDEYTPQQYIKNFEDQYGDLL